MSDDSRPPRRNWPAPLYSALATRWWLRLGAATAMSIGIAFATKGSAAAATLLLGAGGTLLAVALKVRPPDDSCAFCGTRREQVDFLVGAPAVSICTRCAAAAAAKAGEELDRRGKAEQWCRTLLSGLPERSPRALTRPYVEMIAGRTPSPAQARFALESCFRFSHHSFARGLLEAIPEGERTPSDWVNLGVALGEEGRFSDARRATEKARGDAASLPWVLSNSAWFKMREEPAAPEADQAEWLKDVGTAKDLVLSSKPARWEEALSCFLGTEAELRRRLGDSEGALVAIKEASALAPWTGDRVLVRARALADLHRVDEARKEVERALSLLHPESMAAAEARELLAALV